MRVTRPLTARSFVAVFAVATLPVVGGATCGRATALRVGTSLTDADEGVAIGAGGAAVSTTLAPANQAIAPSAPMTASAASGFTAARAPRLAALARGERVSVARGE